MYDNIVRTARPGMHLVKDTGNVAEVSEKVAYGSLYTIFYTDGTAEHLPGSAFRAVIEHQGEV